MEYRNLGNSGLKVSSYCLGTMTYGETTEENDAHLQISESVSKGINFICQFSELHAISIE